MNGRKNQDGFSQFELNPLLKLMEGINNLPDRVKAALEFYASYHKNPTNQKIHTVCIPLIVWTTMVWLSNIPLPLTENVTNLLAIGYCLGYGLYDLKMGIASMAFLGMFSYTASLFAENIPYANTAALVLHAAAWAAQIYGHVKYEGNRPAFRDSLLQSLYIAPLFSLIEACHFLNIKKSPLIANSILNQNQKSSSIDAKENIAEYSRDNNPHL